MLAAGTARGQSDAAFTSGSLGFVGSVDVAAGSFQEHWESGPSFGATLRLPFYLGDVEAGALVARHSGPSPFTSFLGFAGWGGSVPLGSRVRIGGMLSAGDYLMLLDGSATGFSGRENELALGASSTVEVRPFDRLSIETGVRTFRVFTSTPIDLVLVAVGIRYRFAMPDWFPVLMR